ncbi:MAG: TIGR04255 family protein [Candidatus Acidiferrales bacterium]
MPPFDYDAADCETNNDRPMTLTFKNAPLVELIAELRWREPFSPLAGVHHPLQGLSAPLDQFFIRLGGELYQHGFQQVERLVPPNFPVLPMQAVYRFRRLATADTSMLFQVGDGTFSAHAVPPYHSWGAVKGTVENGITALLKARSLEGKELPSITTAILRYINAFGSNLTGDRQIRGFLEEVLGLRIELPPALSRHVQPGATIKTNLSLGLPLSTGANMTFMVGEGTVRNEPKFVLDMAVAYTKKLPDDLGELMGIFDEARTTIHSTFVALTKPIEGLLEPIGGSNVP